MVNPRDVRDGTRALGTLVEAAGAVDAKNAPTAPWKTAQNAVSHSSHRPSSFFTKCYPCSRLTLSPMLPVAQEPCRNGRDPFARTR